VCENEKRGQVNLYWNRFVIERNCYLRIGPYLFVTKFKIVGHLDMGRANSITPLTKTTLCSLHLPPLVNDTYNSCEQWY